MCRDLYVLCADKTMSVVVDELLKRTDAIGIRPIEYSVDRHPGRDGGTRQHWEGLVRKAFVEHKHALVIFDRHGSNHSQSASEIQNELEARMSRNKWRDRCRAIVIEPELESWVWNASDLNARILKWRSYRELRDWLGDRGKWPNQSSKPPKPKAAFLLALKEKDIKYSSSLYGNLTKKARLKDCEDEAFIKFKSTLQTWFPRESKRYYSS